MRSNAASDHLAERAAQGLINVATSSSQVNAAAPIPEAPIGHLQPHACQFSPGSVPEQIEQQKMSAFDAEQRKLDEQLDKSLNICRRQ
ncbi:hypothetical protein [Bradyrhizobium sp. JYMT SZCCT0180]|uniref:hypothetical protein n=1 Tax=Bradyrhizobium sp. JYMT SZCCT0180 TaxID=2807666 RepID=UPI001BAA6531|nr:hypothetical protein [Bradyrhizobium sp. JYMT SZCCT0180]MBR1211601.1 hypothetical protein [Bradyrhizobium sp. JYMT SZCCT0180]